MKPGRLTELLEQLARAPGDDWPDEPPPGGLVGRYRVSRLIGQGGFGKVYLAEDELLRRPVALKTVKRPRREQGPDLPLYKEAEAAAQLSHPNIVTLFDIGRVEEGPYLVMELLRGESLSARLARGPLPPAETVRIAVKVAEGLGHAHRRGVKHRDLKPANVFLGEEESVKILDFGLAQAFGQQRVAGGTAAYMSPEQRRSAPEDERTDVFALGVMLYQMLTGKLPFGASGSQLGLRRARPLEIAPSAALAQLIGEMLETDPVKRPRDGAAVFERLAAIQAELGAPAAAAPSTPSRPVRARRRWRLSLALGAISLATAVAVRLLWPGSPPASPPASRVALADVANETGEPELDVSGLLRTVLEQSTTLDILPRARLLDALRGGSGGVVARIDERSGSEAARRCGAKALLVARLLRFGTAYLMEVRVLDPGTGERHFSFTEQETAKERVPELIDRIGEQVRLRLGESPAAIRQRAMPARALTWSMTAWRHFASGMACAEKRSFAGSFGDCRDELRQAVDIDPGFAMAHLQLSLLGFFQGQPRALQKEALALALKNAERIPPHDRKLLRGWEAFLDGRELEAKALLREAAEAAPDDKHAWFLAGEIPYHRDEFAEALPFFRHVQALDPLWLDAGKHLTLALGATGDLVGLRARAAELEALGPKPETLLALCFARLWVAPASAVTTCERARAVGADADRQLAIALANGDQRAALKAHLGEMAKRDGRVPGFAWYMSLWLLGQEGRWPEWRTQAAQAGDPEDSWLHSTLVEMVLGSGDGARAWREALRILELDRALLSNLAVHFAYQGELERAAQLASYLPPGSPRVTVYEAVVRWRRGDVAGAIEPLRQVAAGAPLSVAPEIPAPLYLLGEALAEAGRDAEAVDALRRFQALPLDNPTWFRPRSLYYLGRSLDRLGDREGARRAIGQLLDLWSHASPEQPLLAEARALGTKLGIR